MTRTSRVGLLFVALALSSNACAGSFGAGVRDYDHGRYPEALAQLQVAEPQASSLPGGERARYALYRGLTHLALGDRPGTLQWLGEAKRALDADPRLLSDLDAGRLAAAWSHLPPPCLENAAVR
jgi:hypothetical protein